MEHFPVYLNLTGREVFLCGGGEKIAEKVRILHPFGPKPILFAGDGLCPELAGDAALTCCGRPLEESDLDRGPAFVITAQEEGEDARISALCRARNIPVNAVDRPALCSFAFPAMICRDRLCVAIGTGGASPAAAAELKRRLTAQIPEQIDKILDWLMGVRADVYAAVPEKSEARACLRQITQGCFDKGRPLTEDEMHDLCRRFAAAKK